MLRRVYFTVFRGCSTSVDGGVLRGVEGGVLWGAERVFSRVMRR